MDYFATIGLFVKVVEHGSFSGAAGAAGVKTSSVSRAISALEADLGVAVFRRTTRKTELTGAGLTFYKASVQILADLTEARRNTTALSAQLAGTLRIRSPVSFGRIHVAPLLPDLLAEMSGVTVDLVLTDDLTFSMGGFDLGIWIGTLPESRFFARSLGAERYVLCASPRYLEQVGRPQWPSELSNFECLTLKEGEPSWIFSSLRSSVLQEVEVFGRIKSNNRSALLSAAVAGAGIARLPTWLCGHHLREGTLATVLDDFDSSSDQSLIHVVHAERLVLSPRAGALVRLLERANVSSYRT
jgi:DNA-binding transcriptional LysR family regulator